MPGICAVSPPISAQPAFLQPRTMPDELLKAMRIEPLGSHVIEEEKGLRAEDGDVVDAMVDQVLADSVVAIHEHGDLQLGADAVDAGHENGLAHLGEPEALKRPPKPPTLPSTSGRSADFSRAWAGRP